MRSIIFALLFAGAIALIQPITAYCGRIVVVNESNYCYQFDIRTYSINIDALFKWTENPTRCLLVKERSTKVYDDVFDSVWGIWAFPSDDCHDNRCISSSASRRLWQKEQDELRPSASRTFKVVIDKDLNATVTIVRN